MTIRTHGFAIAVGSFVVVFGCARSAERRTEIRSDEPDVARVSPSTLDVARLPIRTAPPKTRISGPIVGAFEPRMQVVPQGAPISVLLSFTPSKPLTVFFGGDQRNAYSFPTSLGIRVTNTAGKTVCDSVTGQEIMSFGGLGSDRLLAVGERAEQGFVLNPACKALGEVGRYTITLHRRLMDSRATFKKPGTAYPISCWGNTLHEGPAASPEPGCNKLIDAAPSVTTEFELFVEPFSAMSLYESVKSLYDLPVTEVEKTHAAMWICNNLNCSCLPGTSKTLPSATLDVLPLLPHTLPKGFPAPCSRAP